MPTLPAIEKVFDSDVSYREVLADQKAETRRRIVDGARKVFLRSGFLSANLNEIAQLAGVGKGTLYRHFQSKGELYVAMLAESVTEYSDELTRVIDPEAGTLQQLEQVACFPLEFWRRHPDHQQLIWAMENLDLVGPLSAEILDQVRELLETPIRMLAALIQRGIGRGELRPVDPWETAVLLALCINAVVGPIVTCAPSVIDRDMRAVHRRLRDVMQVGLAARPTATEAAQPAAPASDPT